MMSAQLLISVLLLFVNIANLNASPGRDRIINGVVTDISTRQFQILVLPVYCGGSLISPYWTLTAAHCTVKYTADDLSFAVGVQGTFDYDRIEYNVAILRQHENYDQTTQNNDIALMKSDTQVYYDLKVGPVVIAKSLPPVGSTVIVSGYGYLEEDSGILSEDLMSTDLELVDHSICKQAYPYYLTDNMICADGGDELKDSCQGDSGGPLTFNNQLIGIVSFGTGCAQPGFPGVYTKVYNYIQWITNNTEIKI